MFGKDAIAVTNPANAGQSEELSTSLASEKWLGIQQPKFEWVTPQPKTGAIL
jgi:hypothetical protein